MILAVDIRAGLRPRTREQLFLARLAQVPYVVIALTMADQSRDKHIVELIEQEVRDLLTDQGYPGDQAPAVRVSAAGALKGEPKRVQSVRDLVTAVEEHVPEPVPLADRPFLMAIEDVFSITGRGTVVTGQGRSPAPSHARCG